jgi:hypothetical protein
MGVDVIRNCLARIGCLALIVLLVAGAWWFRHDLTRWWNRLEITSVSEPSEDLARRAEREVEEFVASDGRDGLTLTQAEIQSLLTFRAQELLPDGISETQIEMRDSTLLLSARVDPFGIEGLASPELLERFLSDSARVVVELAPGVLQPGDDGPVDPGWPGDSGRRGHGVHPSRAAAGGRAAVRGKRRPAAPADGPGVIHAGSPADHTR